MDYQPVGADLEIIPWLAFVIGWILFWVAILFTVKGSQWRGWSASNADTPVSGANLRSLLAKGLTADEARWIAVNMRRRDE